MAIGAAEAGGLISKEVVVLIREASDWFKIL
jgi:hypothetical protein